MPVSTGQTVTQEFTTRSPSTGAAANADSLPTGKLVINGVVNAATVTVSTTATTGVYTFSVTMPTLAQGDRVQVRITATVGGVTDNSDELDDAATGGTTIENINASTVINPR